MENDNINLTNGEKHEKGNNRSIYDVGYTFGVWTAVRQRKGF